MKIFEGSRVIGAKNPYTGRHGVVLGLEGTGHGRRWRIKWDVDDAIDLVHARSLILETEPNFRPVNNFEEEPGRGNRNGFESRNISNIDSDSEDSDFISAVEDNDEDTSRLW